MNRISVGHGLYHDGIAWWIRPSINGSRMWRKLASLNERDALVEMATLISDHARSMQGLCRSPWAPKVPITFASAAEAYIAVQCPDRRGRTQPESENPSILRRIMQWWGHRNPQEITLQTATEYGATRRETPRAADVELSVVSCVLRHALGRSPLDGRARQQNSRDVRHSREVMPADGDELHTLARALLARRSSQGIGWQLLFQALTGCRTNELLALRMQPGPKGPGWIEGRYLYVRRSKGGLFPYVELHPALSECIAAHRQWHAETCPNSPYWLPGADGVLPLNRVALTHALSRVSGPKRTAHGLRAFFVTVCRSRGEPDSQVAARIGDASDCLIARVYGNLPEVWAGGEPLSWLPKTGEPAWTAWRPAENVVQFNAAVGSS